MTLKQFIPLLNNLGYLCTVFFLYLSCLFQTVNITLSEFVTSVLNQLRNNAGQTNALGQAPSQNIINFVVSWAHHEGGSQTNDATFNPLNTMQQEAGSTQAAGLLPGIQAYPDSATGEKGTIDALQNGLYGALLHALTTNDEGGLGFTAPFTMAANIAADLSVWVSGRRSPVQAAYCLAIMQGAGISNANVPGGNMNGGPGASAAAIKAAGDTVIGQGIVASNNPLDALTSSLSSLSAFFGNLNNLLQNPTAIIKVLGGAAMIITGLVLGIKSIAR